MRLSAGAMLAIIALGSSGCTTGPSVRSGLPAVSSPTTPSEPTPTAPAPSAPAPIVTSVKISGNLTLASLGEISQLTATASLSDGTTKDVTSDAKWSTPNPNVIAMGTPGEVRVISFGMLYVSAIYSNKFSSAQVTATPVGTFAMYGRVREPGSGSVAGARVTENTTHRSVTTDGNGDFTIGELPQRQANLVAEKDGFETATVNATFAGSASPYADVPVQRLVRVTAGQTVTPDDLAPNDLAYPVGALRCVDCRLIRVVVDAPGTLHVRATWSNALKLTLFAEGRALADGAGEVIADLPVSTQGEVLLYLGAAPPAAVTSHTRFKFETSMQ